MRIGLIAAAALLTAGAAPLWAQGTEQAVIDATVANGCKLSREDARRELRSTGATPQEIRAIIRDLVSEGRGRINGGVFVYEDGACAGKAAAKTPKAEPSARPQSRPEPAEEEPAPEQAATASAAPEDRTDDMVALIRANDCEMDEDEAEVVFDAARLGYLEIASYLTTLVEDGKASFEGRTVVLSEDLCEAAN